MEIFLQHKSGTHQRFTEELTLTVQKLMTRVNHDDYFRASLTVKPVSLTRTSPIKDTIERNEREIF